MRPPSILTIPITLARHSAEPLHEQIAGQVSAAIQAGLLVPQAQLPSTRSLAALLGVSRGVIIAAYELLFASGCVHSRLGSGTYVATAKASGARHAVSTRRPVIDLRPGQPCAEGFPLAAWRAAWRRAGFQRPPAQAPPALGVPRLRDAIGAHLTRTRGMSLIGKEVVVTGGQEHGLRAVLAALGVRGPVVAIEEPSPATLARAVIGPAALPVDTCGALTHRIPPGCRAIVISADAQIPYGHILCASRREAAARWARESGGHIIELACDTVVRAELSGLPRLTALARDHCVLIGSFAELFAAGIQIGYAVMPRDLAAAVGAVISERADQPSYVAQLALESLLDDGTVVRQMHRLGRLYVAKRRLLARCGLSAAGTVNSAVVPVPDADTAVAELASRRIRVNTLAAYHFSGSRPPSALVIGYGHLPEQPLGLALTTLASLFASARDAHVRIGHSDCDALVEVAGR